MAQTSYGAIPLKFGTDTFTGYIVDSVGREASTNVTEITDEIGDIVGVVTGFGNKTKITVETMPKAATTVIAVGAVMTIGTVEYLVESVSEKQGKGEVMKYTITANKHGSIDYTP